ncbi:MAG: hypothetical protein IPM39_16235 [Chloroflexi bacterium]|nr:hypothetical protein [Chloroflexota bacterium]
MHAATASRARRFRKLLVAVVAGIIGGGIAGALFGAAFGLLITYGGEDIGMGLIVGALAGAPIGMVVGALTASVSGVIAQLHRTALTPRLGSWLGAIFGATLTALWFSGQFMWPVSLTFLVTAAGALCGAAGGWLAGRFYRYAWAEPDQDANT